MRKTLFLLCCYLLFTQLSANAQKLKYSDKIIVGAAQTSKYLPLIQGKTIAVVANQTSTIGNTHLVDSLLHLGIKIKCVFAPEHGFRGEADAGEHVANGLDKTTNLPIVSLYGNHKKPTVEDLQGVDYVIFDIQDVGARFYTYISTMHYVMEACAEQHIPLLVMDRPNPNGFYVDGPVLEKDYESFVGMHPVPIVHGMTIAEYACMVNEEGWLKNGIHCDLHYITCINYTHNTLYKLPIKPSPNLPNEQSILLYPGLCLFEGTNVSVGRGTDNPFQVIGHPNYAKGNYCFTPQSAAGAKKPLYQNQLCKGYALGDKALEVHKTRQIPLKWLLLFYANSNNKVDFFNDFFQKLAGNAYLKQQITAGNSEKVIRDSWKADLKAFKTKRKKYLLYPDFE